MRKQDSIGFNFIVLVLFLVMFQFQLYTKETHPEEPISIERIEQKVKKTMEEGCIPGLALVIIEEDKPLYVKGFGYADLEKKIPVTSETLFELASVSKSFTGLAVLHCEMEGIINLNDRITKYFPEFKAYFNGEEQHITLEQFLHQTSGFNTNTISRIQPDSSDQALQHLVQSLSGIELGAEPGTRYQYATINYDVLGAVIEKASGLSFEDYMKKNILEPLGLNDTFVGIPQNSSNIAVGYKKSFFKPTKYDPPVFRGNTPAGYILSNSKDMAKWIELQLGLKECELDHLILLSHEGDSSVPPSRRDLTNYAAGWFASALRNGFIWHGGLNPNFTSYVAFSSQNKKGVVVLANSNSIYTDFIGRWVMTYVNRGVDIGEFTPPRDVDATASVISIILSILIFFMLIFMGYIFMDLIKGRRGFEPITGKKILKILGAPIILIPFIWGIYIIPRVVMDFSWDSAFVWTPFSFQLAVYMVYAILGLGFICYVLSVLLPHKNKYLKSMPMLFVLSFITGGANAVVIFLITISLFTPIEVKYLLYYYGLTLVLYIAGRKILQTKLIGLTFEIVYDLRVKLLEKIFYTSYQKFEKLEDGRILATLNNDTGQLGGSVNMLIALITSIITTVGVFVYLATIALWATLMTLGIIAFIATLYYFVSQKARGFLEEARDTQNVYMGLLNGMVDGFKELSLHYNKRISYKEEIVETTDKFRKKIIFGQIKFINAFLVGESLLFVVLGTLGFGIPVLFPEITNMTLLSFIMVLLFLIGPINGILRSVPGIMQIKIAWDRINGFMKDIPSNLDPLEIDKLDHHVTDLKHIEAKNVYFEYETTDEKDKFVVGPIDLKVDKGEIVFIIGGNGSGKTTLAKLLTGLYVPSEGEILLDGKPINSYQLGEYFSVVFGDFHLFEKLYNVDLTGKEDEILEYLNLLRLDDKVVLENNAFSTLELSGGQRKRLALLRCYLEDRPVYLFDEVAADQDPEFRKFFYRDLLLRMKKKGKTIIAITHDDHYFDVADRIVKMDMGKFDAFDKEEQVRVTK